MALTAAMIMLSYHGRKASSKTPTPAPMSSAEEFQVKTSVLKWLSQSSYGGNLPVKLQFKK